MVDWESTKNEEEGEQQMGLLLTSNKHLEPDENRIIESWRTNLDGPIELVFKSITKI